jgi:hypothetical protein
MKVVVEQTKLLRQDVPGKTWGKAREISVRILCVESDWASSSYSLSLPTYKTMDCVLLVTVLLIEDHSLSPRHFTQPLKPAIPTSLREDPETNQHQQVYSSVSKVQLVTFPFVLVVSVMIFHIKTFLWKTYRHRSGGWAPRIRSLYAKLEWLYSLFGLYTLGAYWSGSWECCRVGLNALRMIKSIVLSSNRSMNPLGAVGYPLIYLNMYWVSSLRYKSEGRWFDSRLCHWNFSLI